MSPRNRCVSHKIAEPDGMGIEGEGEGEGGFIAREGIEHSQNRQPERCIPCHVDVVGDLVRRVAVPAA